MSETAMPPVVPAEEWAAARAELLVAEKEATRTLDRIAAQRRRLPMVRFGEYTFAAADGPVTLLELFGEHRQLALYQFMDAGPDAFCPGCTGFTKNVVNLTGLAGNDVAWATVSDMPIEQMAGYWKQMGWEHIPFASSAGTTFSADCGVGGGFLLSMFLRDGDNVFRTYTTGQRGVDRLLFSTNVSDLAAYGRQQDWEDSPAGWPQTPTYG
ncbi:DUF899 family protein [Kribbella speibonae]|uniref:DUF899 domain-containing protein n=1 Tax=Kribbella speibonae TaxID=1572660 RepID=A0A4R0J6H6_9ACTN|nr:DUF899 family protein [Kribbella speibonae]TCC20141.1 DUF899 domain-containing protein [Kribbella speibonae]TCC41407.1 DUF899 domain-containing protein [Kribbella speibonae]